MRTTLFRWQPLQPLCLQNSQVFHCYKLVKWHLSVLTHVSYRPVKEWLYLWVYNTCASCGWWCLSCHSREKSRISKAVQNIYYGKKNCYAEWNLTCWKSPILQKPVFSQLDRLWGHLSWGKWYIVSPREPCSPEIYLEYHSRWITLLVKASLCVLLRKKTGLWTHLADL